MDKEKVLKLAKLARIDISDKEAESLTHEFESILNYVGEVKKVTTNNQQPTTHGEKHDFSNMNRMRDDENPHESGIYTEELLEVAPMREGNYVKVKKIL